MSDDEIILSKLDDIELGEQMQDDLYDGMKEEVSEGVQILLARGWIPYDVLTKVLVLGMEAVGNDFRDGILPEALAGRPLGDPLVLDAIERWASAEAAEVLGSLFVVAAIVLVVAALPAWLMRERPGGDEQPQPAERDDARVDEAGEGAIAGF